MENTTFWKDRWENNDIGWHEPKTHPILIEFLSKLNLKKGDTVFVPFCGASVDMFYLAQQGYQLIGSELSPIACERFFQEQNLPFSIHEKASFTLYQSENISLYCGDYFSLTPDSLTNVAAVYDRAALFALPVALRKEYVQQLKKIIPQGHNNLLITLSYDNERDAPPYIVTASELRQLYNKNFEIELLGEFNNTPVCKHLEKRGFINLSEQIYHIFSKSK